MTKTDTTVIYTFPDVPTLAELERKNIETAVYREGGNKVEAAKTLGITLKTLYNKLQKYQIEDKLSQGN